MASRRAALWPWGDAGLGSDETGDLKFLRNFVRRAQNLVQPVHALSKDCRQTRGGEFLQGVAEMQF